MINKKGGTRGFTIVELLIVVVVIAILATITIVSYNGIQNRAHDSAVKSDLSAFAKQYEINAINSSDGKLKSPQTFTSSDNFRFTKNSYVTNRNNVYVCITPEANAFSISAMSKSGKIFQMVNGTISEFSRPVFEASSNCDILGTTYDVMRSTSIVYIDLPGSDKWRPYVN